MERIKGGITAGVLVWTPAPAYSCPSSPEGSDFSWDEEPDEDFQSQMDENGIIGLAESQGQLEVNHREEEVDLLWDIKTPEPEDGPPPSALEEISCHLSELLDSEPLSQPTEYDCQTSYPQDEQVADESQSVLSEDWTDAETDARSPTIHRPDLNTFPERDRTLNMTDEDPEEKDGPEDAQRRTDHSFPVSEERAPHINGMESLDFSQQVVKETENITPLEINVHSEQHDCKELEKSKSHFLLTSQLSSPSTPHTLSFPHLSSEELMNNCGIEAETFPEQALPNSMESSLSSHRSSAPKAYHTIRSEGEEHKNKATLQTSAKSPVMKIRPGNKNHDGMSEDRRLHSPHQNHQPPTPSPRKTNCDSQKDWQVSSHAQLTAKARKSPSESSPSPPLHCTSAKNNQRNSKTSHTDLHDIRKGQLSHPLPDFSKVEPRVRFPKGGYKPPKSRAVVHAKTSHPALPVVFKSPAEIVREVLLSSTDGTPEGPSTSGTQKRLNRTVPEEFRCPQQASTLVQQLQEDYNKLLTKYAEAENTIDRLRLEAKVGLYSDPPKPSMAVLSGVIQEGSKVMTLSFPQAQRAEFGADSAQITQQRENSENSRNIPTQEHPNSVSSRKSESITADHLTETLTNQTCRFQLQVDSFEKLLKKLKPCEQLKGLSTLAEGQESLERAYLDSRAQFQMLNQRHGTALTFDPDRELEGQIFKSGMRLEELRERVEQNQRTLEPPPSPSPHSDMLSVSMLEAEPIPQSPLSAAHPDTCVGVEVSSVSEESDEEEEEILPSHLLPLYDKHHRVETDFSNLIGCYQSFKELPGLLDRHVDVMGCDFKDSSSPRHGGSKGRTTTVREKTISAQLQPAVDCGPPSGPPVRSQVGDSTETRLEAPRHTSVLPGQPGKKMKTAGNRKTLSSSLNSLSESTETGNMVLKAKAKTAVAPSLDGVVSPETDSGFMGSESSQLTPAVHSPLQQRAVISSIRTSGPHMKNTTKPESAASVRKPLVVSRSQSQPSLDPPAEDLNTPGGCTASVRRRGRENRCSSSSLATSTSPLHWPENTLQPWPSSLTSQSENSSDHGEEKVQDNLLPQSANQQHCFHRNPSLHVPYHHDNLKTQSSVQLINHQEALQSLQQEVNKLKERLEGSLRLPKPASPLKVPPPVTEDTRGHAPLKTPTPEWLDLRSSERRRGQRERWRNGEEEEEVRGGPRPTLRKRSASLPRYRPETHTTSDSEHVQSEPRPSTSSYIPASLMTPRGRNRTRARFEHHKDGTARHTSTSEDTDETEPACPRCTSERTGAQARPIRSKSSPRLHQSYCSHCPLCGSLQSGPSRAAQPENQDPVYAPRWSQPMRSLQRDRVGVKMPVAPPPTVLGSVPVVPYVPVYPSTLYFSSPVTTQTHSQPFNISTSPSTDGRSEVRGHLRRCLSVDHQERLLSSSLTRAITAARNMRRVSGRMAHSLTSGLENMSFLTTTY